MPRNVATPEQAAVARAELGVDKGFGAPKGMRVDNEIASNAVRGVRPLSKADRRVLNSGEPPVFIYNVSPVFQWGANAGGRSYGVIPKRKAGAKISVALEIPGALVRDYDAGNRMRQTYTEIGIDIAEDILSCSKEMPGLPQNDLTNYGCFYLIGERFEDLTEDAQENILREANAKHEEKCRLKVGEADQLADSEVTRRWISEPYRLCAIFLAEECGDKTMYDRRWVTTRGRSSQKVIQECKFCGFEMKRGLIKCPNCKEVLDQDAYDALKAEKAPKRARSQPSA